MGGASRLLVVPAALFSRPSPLRVACLAEIPAAALSASFRGPRSFPSLRPRRRSSLSVRSESPIHTEAVLSAAGTRSDDGAVFSASRPWPEWAKFVDFVVALGFSDRRGSEAMGGDDESLLGGEEMGEEFVKAADACMRFARERPELLRSLRKDDVRVLVENGSPSIFKNGDVSVRRLRSFLDENEANELQSEPAGTDDIMRYLLSYVWHSWSNEEERYFKLREIIEATCRKLFSELLYASQPTSNTESSESTPRQTPLKYEQFSRPPGQNTEMKRGDWICAKCSFMNFARNLQCLECKEARPKRILTGREWECPQCDFFNYGRNMSCLRCDCRRPAKSLQSGAVSRDSSDYSGSSTIDQILNESSVSKSENKLERSLPTAQNIGRQSKLGSSSLSSESISQSLDRILGHASASSRSNDPASTEGDDESRAKSDTSDYMRKIADQRRDPDYAPFVPLSPDMFSKPGDEVNQQSLENEDCVSAGDDNQSEQGFNRLEGKTEMKNDVGSADAIDRWSSEVENSENIAGRNVAKEEDFTDIMPIRRGENRFVISKKKDRSLTSPQYKRRMAMEQANNSNFVPFVPFPPGYFAKKDKEPDNSTATEFVSDLTSAPANPMGETIKNEGFKGNNNSLGDPVDTLSQFDVRPTNQMNFKNSNSNSPQRETNERKGHDSYGKIVENSSGFPRQSRNHESQRWNSMQSQDNTFTVQSSAARPQQKKTSPSFSETGKSSFTGKSLEGSAVSKEPDPLDMSEEAKAQRWFRRVAQIKDISELANIPDEDFPQIIPIRKGVNRFVVSKRKTPLERRLTSPQYRKNLPISGTEPDKDSN